MVVQGLQGDTMAGCSEMAPMALLQDGCRPRKHHKGLVEIAACMGTGVLSNNVN